MNKLFIAMILALSFTACGPNRIVRESSTYTAELVAHLARQKQASTLLKRAATTAQKSGDQELCKAYAAAALRIDHRAHAEVNRALWLAKLPYPKEDGSMPKKGESQADPGDPGPFDKAESEVFCEED